MNKKIIIGVTAILFLIICIIVIFFCISKPVDNNVSEQTITEVNQINNASYLRGQKLLGPQPENYNNSVSNVLGNQSDYADSENYDTYICSEYNKQNVITTINIFSSESNLYNIHIGDYLTDAEKILTDKGYKKDRSYTGKQLYKKVSISFMIEYTDSSIIKCISVSVDTDDDGRIY